MDAIGLLEDDHPIWLHNIIVSIFDVVLKGGMILLHMKFPNYNHISLSKSSPQYVPMIVSNSESQLSTLAHVYNLSMVNVLAAPSVH